MIRVRIDVVEELLYARCLKVCAWCIGVESNRDHEVSKLVFVENSIAIRIDLFEKLDEVGQELLVLLQLEIEDALEEHGEFQLTCFGIVVLLVVHHRSRHCSPSCGAALVRIVAHQI